MSDANKTPTKSLSLDDFRIMPVSGRPIPAGPLGARAAGLPPDLLGSLADLRDSTWRGAGFNQIWRPFDGLQSQPPQDFFLELNETSEILQFVEIQGDIPNRGLLQADITLHGLTYLQRISDVNVLQNGQPTGIHIEPGIWLRVPNTTNPQDPETVAQTREHPARNLIGFSGNRHSRQHCPGFSANQHHAVHDCAAPQAHPISRDKSRDSDEFSHAVNRYSSRHPSDD